MNLTLTVQNPHLHAKLDEIIEHRLASPSSEEPDSIQPDSNLPDGIPMICRFVIELG